MSSNSKKDKQRREAAVRNAAKEKEETAASAAPHNRKRNMLIIAVSVVLAVAALALVYFIATHASEEGGQQTTNPNQTVSDATNPLDLSDAGFESVAYRDGYLPREFALVLEAGQADGEAAAKKYGTAMYVGDQKISVSEFMIDYCDIYSSTLNEVDRSIEENGYNRIGMDVSKVPSVQNRTSKETWAQAITKKAFDDIQLSYEGFYAAVSAGFQLDRESANSLYTSYSSLMGSAAVSGKTADELIGGVYGEGVTFNMFAMGYIMDFYRGEYEDYLSSQTSETATDEEIKALFDANPDKYCFVDIRLAPLEAQEFELPAAGQIKNEEDYLEYVNSVNRQVYTDYNAAIQTNYFGIDYEAIDARFAGEVAEWIFDSSRSAGDFAVLKGELYSCAVLITRTKYYSTSKDYRSLYVPFNTSMDTLQSDEEYETAEALAQKYYDEWNSGERTEESFAALCTRHSQNRETSVNGGLNSAVRTNLEREYQIAKWCNDSKRAEGDCEIIVTAYGMEIIYFIKNNAEDYDWIELCRAEIADKAIEQHEEDLLANSSCSMDTKGAKTVVSRGDEFAVKKMAEIAAEKETTD